MRYKSQILSKIEVISGTIQQIDIAANQGDKKKLYEISEALKDQLEDIRQVIEIQSDEFEKQFQ